MHALVTANQLVYNKRDSEISGWIHVAELPVAEEGAVAARTRGCLCRTVRRVQQHLVFHKRFCRLRELICTFYDSDAPEHAASPIAHHVVIAVERVHERNKAFQVTDYEDRRLVLYTALGADFDDWFNAFATAVRKTRVSKTHIPSQRHGDDLETTSIATSYYGATRSLPRVTATIERTRASTAALDDVVTECDAIAFDERTRTAWFYVRSPWWTLRRRRARRYFVVSGTMLSCFGVNHEGQLADFTQQVVAVAYDPERDPLAVAVVCVSGRTLHLSRTSGPDVLRNWVAYLQTTLGAVTQRTDNEDHRIASHTCVNVEQQQQRCQCRHRSSHESC